MSEEPQDVEQETVIDLNRGLVRSPNGRWKRIADPQTADEKRALKDRLALALHLTGRHD